MHFIPRTGKTDGMRILVADDDRAVRESLRRSLTFNGYQVETAFDGQDALEHISAKRPDALVLDLMMPRMDGLEVCRRLRSNGDDLPILVLTARDSVDDRVAGLETGADDYLCKPFAPAELIARVRALVRRHEHRQAGVYRLGDLSFDTHSQRASLGERPLSLTARESIVLQYLMARSGEVVAREQLNTLVPGWGPGVSDNALELLMSRLRAKIEPAMVLLRTVRGLGYILEARDEPPGR